MKAKAKQKEKDLYYVLGLTFQEMIAISQYVRDIETSCNNSVTKVLHKLAAKYAPKQKLDSKLLFALYIAGYEQASRQSYNELLKHCPHMSKNI